MLSAGADLAHAEVETVVYDYLSARFPKVTTWDPETPLLGSGAIDSLGILEIMTFLDERFDIALEDSDFDRENFATPASLVRFIIERKRN